MSYKEPGVYLELVNNRPNTATPSSLIPVILGEGPLFMDHEKVPVVASVSGTDTLPSSVVTAVSAVYLTLTGTPVAASNYTLNAETSTITWSEAFAEAPAAGQTYYVTYESRPENLQYQAAFVDSFDKLDTAYGGMFRKTTSLGSATTINPVYLGAYLALEAGSPGVYCVQVKPADVAVGVVAADYTTALANVVSFIDGAYQIVPMTQDAGIIASVVSHINSTSTVDERKERVAFITKAMTEKASNGVVTTEMVIEATDYAKAQLNKRLLMPFVPSSVTKSLSDGNIHELTGEYFCAALAGVDTVIPVERSLTRQKVLNFLEIKDNKMTRAVKNQLAEAGIVVLEQSGGVGSPISIRHGVTTKMDNVQDREYSIVKVTDYVAKFLRNNLDGYIGVFNIDDFFVTKVKGTLTSAFNVLKESHKINDGVIKTVAQDADNPDTLLVVVSIKPPYPCNYIDVTLVVE